jgi:response regulator RpfG family c-di-GMP phosphodiesterase
MQTASAPKVLLVDDERNVLEGLSMHLRRHYVVLTASSGAEGLEKLSTDNSVAVVVSDMRMPGMDGAAFLTRARQVAPAAVRILLTGQADVTSAIAAINGGQIFRFLTKPTAPPDFLRVVVAANEQYRLIQSEKVLLEQTLSGSLRAITQILALTSPQLFGRATRIRQTVTALMHKLSIPACWQIDVAAMLLPMAQISLPPETAEKVCRAAALTAEERKMVSRLPELSDQLLAHIPRLETVRVMLANAQEPFHPANCIEPGSEASLVIRGAMLIKAAAAFDALQQSGLPIGDVIGTMLAEPVRFDEATVLALKELYGESEDTRRIQEVSILGLRAGMIFADDVVSRTGMLLVARGFEVTPMALERLRNYQSGTLPEKMRVALVGEPP